MNPTGASREVGPRLLRGIEMIRGWEHSVRGFAIVTWIHFVDTASDAAREAGARSNAAAASLPTGSLRFATGSASTFQHRADSASQTDSGTPGPIVNPWRIEARASLPQRRADNTGTI